MTINEVMASNATTLSDEDGDTEDWVELYNHGQEPINLMGYGLTDNKEYPFKWILPDTVIAPNSYLLVWASGKNRLSIGAPLHSNFRIESSGEELILSCPMGTIVDEVQPIHIPTDVSYGRQPDGTGEWKFFALPTPAVSNTTTGYSEVLSPPAFSVSGGFYSNSIALSLSHPDSEVTLVYSLDGSTPTLSNLEGETFRYKKYYRQQPSDPDGDFYFDSYQTKLYSEPISITNRSNEPDRLTHISTTYNSQPWYFPEEPVRKGTVVRAKAYKPNAIPSEVVTNTYFLFESNETPHILPVLSITAQADDLFDYDQGIYCAGADFDSWRNTSSANAMGGTPANYHRRGIGSERIAHLEVFEPNSQTASLHKNIGIRIHGGYSRARSFKSLRIYARTQYGSSSLDYPFIPDIPYNSYKRLILRNAGSDSYRTLFRDEFMQKMVSHLNFETQGYEPAIVYINGEYWGIHNIRERYDRHYLARVYGVDEDKVDLLEAMGTVKEGSASHYNAMRSYITSTNPNTPTYYSYIETQMDLINFTDYQIAQIFLRNTDWPGKNLDFWRHQTDTYQPNSPYGHDGRWRWLMFDVDHGFGLAGTATAYMDNTINHATNPSRGGTEILRNILNNEQYRIQFINRFADLLNTTFLPERVIGFIEQFKARIEPEVPTHIARWSLPEDMEEWNDHIEVMINFANHRPYYQRQHIRNFFDIEGEFTANLDVSNPDQGFIRVNTIDITHLTEGVPETPYPWSGIYFVGIPIEIEAIPYYGYTFSHWEGIEEPSSVISITPNADINLKAHFTPNQENDSSTTIHFWALTQSLPNDTPLESIATTHSISQRGNITFKSALDGYPFQPSSPKWRRGSLERRNDPTDINYQESVNGNVPYQQAEIRGIQLKEPFFAEQHCELVLSIPTKGFKDIKVSFAARNDGSNAIALLLDYCTVNDTCIWVHQKINPIAPNLSDEYNLFEIDLTSAADASDNPNLKIRIRPYGNDLEQNNGGRLAFNNISVTGIPTGYIPLPPTLTATIPLQELIEYGEGVVINLNNHFADPQGHNLTYTITNSFPTHAEAQVIDNLLVVTPLKRGDTQIAIVAKTEDGIETEHSTRALIYPEPLDLTNEEFLFNTWGQSQPERTYPPSMLFLQSDGSDPSLATPLLFPYHMAASQYHVEDFSNVGFPYRNSRRTRINGLGENGLSMINTGTNRDLGGALIAISTLGHDSLRISWNATTILPNQRSYAIRLQYRIGHRGNFHDLLINGSPVEYATNIQGHWQEFHDIVFPDELLNHEYVQLLWRYYHTDGNSGPRAELGIGSIRIYKNAWDDAYIKTFTFKDDKIKDLAKDGFNIYITTNRNTNIEELTPEISISQGASISPAPNSQNEFPQMDFTDPVEFIVTSANGMVQNRYVVHVTTTRSFPVTLHSSPSDGGNPTEAEDYGEGEIVNLNANPNEGFIFTSWTNPDDFVVSESANYSLVMPADSIILIANYKRYYEVLLNVDMSNALDFNPTSNSVSVRGVHSEKEKIITLSLSPYSNSWDWNTTLSLPAGTFSYRYHHTHNETHEEFEEEHYRTIIIANNLIVINTWKGKVTPTHTIVDASFSAYPNPFQEQIILNSSVEIKSIRISDLLGYPLITEHIHSTTGVINTDGIPSGIYIVTVIHTNGARLSTRMFKR